jgi:hypothetical protein
MLCWVVAKVEPWRVATSVFWGVDFWVIACSDEGVVWLLNDCSEVISEAYRAGWSQGGFDGGGGGGRPN